jgi:hypothetical protein
MGGAMGPWLLVATGLSAVNAIFLGTLTAVWIRNYRTFGSGMTAGLAGFAATMLVENLLAIVFFFSTGMLYAGDPTAQQAVVALRAVQTVALAALTYVTLK